MVKKLEIIVDTREQDPLVFPSSQITVVKESLGAGDYMARFDGVLGKISVERKSLADCFASFSGDNYRREKEKWTRAHEAGLEYIIAIEATITQMRAGHTYRQHGEFKQCQKDGLAQIRQLCTISQKYKVPVMYFSGRDDMSFWIQEYLLTPSRVG